MYSKTIGKQFGELKVLVTDKAKAPSISGVFKKLQKYVL